MKNSKNSTRAEDSGEFAFVLCKRGLEQLIGQRLKTGATVTVDIEGRIAMDDSEYIQFRYSRGKQLQYRYRKLVRTLLDGMTVLDSTSVLEGVGFSQEWSDWIEVPKEKD